MSTAEERMQSEIEELEQENRLLRARNTRLEVEAKVASVREPVAWAKQTDKKLRITHMNMQGEDGWHPLGYSDITPPAQPAPVPCKHEVVYEDYLTASFAFCKHCNKEWTEEMQHAAHRIKENT